jgi:predicted small metal-binding protein
MGKKVTCPLCGHEITGESDDALVAAADAHGDENHGMRAPREMIISSATDA